MKIRYVLLAMIACAAMAAPIMSLPSQSADAATQRQDRRIRFLDFNFAGNGFNGGSTGAPVTDTVAKIAEQRAEIIGLNEMCYTQWVALRDQLKAKPGYAGLTEHVVVTNYNITNCVDPVVNPEGWYVMGLLSIAEEPA